MFPKRHRVFQALLLLLMVLSLCITSATAAMCPPDGDINQDGGITPADALLIFQQFLGLANPSLTPCQQEQADVDQNNVLTPADALCIFQQFLGLPSCIDQESTPALFTLDQSKLDDTQARLQ